ncbi:MAG TPA: hypothetical protein VFK14_08465 [Solirubrobacterales bacterium]|nr:hypothetical protein [Solirubrobacterales bacterium]
MALVVALGGTVYAAGKINGHAIKVKSLPGNRLALKSVPANRLKPGTIPPRQFVAGSIQGDRLAPGSVTGLQVDVSTLGQVPSAFHAETAESARDAETALNAANAENATRINGYEAGCRPGTVLFAGACWQTTASATAMSLPNAASACASQGGELPGAFMLAAFGQQPGISIGTGDEWSSTLATYSGVNAYSALTVTPAVEISASLSTNSKKFRCVLPLLS